MSQAKGIILWTSQYLPNTAGSALAESSTINKCGKSFIKRQQCMKLLAKCITFIIFSLRRILMVNYSIFILQPKILRLRHKNTLPISHRCSLYHIENSCLPSTHYT